MQQVPGWIRIGDIVVHGLESARNCRFFTQCYFWSKNGVSWKVLASACIVSRQFLWDLGCGPKLLTLQQLFPTTAKSSTNE